MKSLDKVNELVKDITLLIRNNSHEEIKHITINIPAYLMINKLTIEDLSYLYNQIVSFLSRNYSNKISDLNVGFMDYDQIIGSTNSICCFMAN